MRLIYQGPHDGVHVPLPDGREITVERNGEIEVADDLGRRLLEQPSNWRQIQPQGGKKATTAKEV